MKLRIPYFYFACLGFAASAMAQTPQPTPPLPVAPFVVAPPPNSSYSITIEDTGDARKGSSADAHTLPQSKTDRPVFIQVWQDANTKKIVVQHANGQKSEGYLFESGFVIRSTANSNRTFVSAGTRGRDAALEIFTKEFPGTQWITGGLYVGIQKGEFYSFVQNPQEQSEASRTMVGDDGGPPSDYHPIDHLVLKALIRVSDKMPSIVELGTAKYTFSPVQPWNGTITIPDNFKFSAEQYSKELSVVEALRKKHKNHQ